jgi:hypothetical protein
MQRGHSYFLFMRGHQNSYRISIRASLAPPRYEPTGGLAMLDLIYLVLGLGLFGLMGLYARWAANA